MAKRKGKLKGRVVVQNHHISYDPEIMFKIYKGEHWVMSQLQRRKRISKGFIISLKVWLALNEHKAVEIGSE